MLNELFIGLMSGTSLDGIDAVLVSFDDENRNVVQLASRQDSFPDRVRNELLSIIRDPLTNKPDLLKQLDHELALLYSGSVTALLRDAGKGSADISAVGCHGQTVDHQPDADPPFSVQLGDGGTIAKTTGIRTVSDFRRADLELGGQGAPLVPAFHEWAFAQADGIAGVVNIGGIANITILDPDLPVTGFDTGPGNTLIDLWAQQELNQNYDTDGSWGRRGTPQAALLKRLLDDAYFSRPPPKSTGREYFNMPWLQQQLRVVDVEIDPVDVQATLTELTASTIATAARDHRCQSVWLCGGGAHNDFLKERIARHLGDTTVHTTSSLGIEPDWVEAIAFAWLAMARINGHAAGRPSVTGARSAALLGDIHLPQDTQ